MTNIARFPTEWSKRLVSTLVASGDLAKDEGERCLQVAQDECRSVAEILARVGLLEPTDLLARMAELSGLSAVDIYKDRPMGEAFKAVPQHVAQEVKAIGYRLEGDVLTLASVEPLSAAQLRDLSTTLHKDVIGTVLADPVGIERVMDAVYPRLAQAAAPQAENGATASSSTEGSGAQAEMAVPATGAPAGTYPAGVPAASTPDLGPMYGSPGRFGPTSTSFRPPAAPTTQDPVQSFSVPPAPAQHQDLPPQAGPPPAAYPPPPGAPLTALQSANGSSAGSALDRAATPPGFRGTRLESRPFSDISGNKADLDIDDLLTYAVENGASDLHLTHNLPPSIRVDGSIRPIDGVGKLTNDQIRNMVYSILTQSLRERFETEKELDTSHAVHGVGRFRVNVYQQRGAIGAALRAIPHDIPPFETLGLPDVVAGFAQLRRGLVLVTGPTGSGKSTTLASLINIINRTKPLHIVTIEDPIEFLHSHDRAIINQREVGNDTFSFAAALKRVLRQDPDVILVGELRDTETISTALTAAETGHLVFATLHTQDAPQTIDRIIDVFPSGQQDQVRIQLAGSLEAVVTQQLLVKSSGVGRLPVTEVMVVTPALRNLIRTAKTHQIYSLMQTGGAVGMQTMDQALARAVGRGLITEAMALDRCHDANELSDHLKADV